jgi:hypothetical protein
MEEFRPMKHGLIAAFALVFTVLAGACTDDAAPPRPDAAADAPKQDAAPEASAADSATPDLPRDSAAADSTAPDGPRADLAVEPGPDGPAADLAAPDLLARDTLGLPDTSPDRTPDSADAGVACAAVPRQMLCTTYCQGIATLCTGGNRQFATADECRAACDAPTSTWACGAQGDTTGNSVLCRLAHLVLAGVGAAAIECPDAGPGSPACR